MTVDAEHNDSEGLEDVVDGVFAEYVDRLIAGEILDAEQIEKDHPTIAGQLIPRLEVYREIGSQQAPPLGTLGDYTLRCQIGRGGMGTVYDAWQNSMDRRVALKVLPRALAADTRAATRFIREAQIAGKLDHPNVVHVHGTGVEEQVPYYAMEFVEGETLAQILARTKDAEPETETLFGAKDEVAYFHKMAKAFAEVSDGLQHAHSKGVVHRDIKPSNLILDGEGRLRILDFGLARLEGQDSLTISGDVVGTPLYMSPEQARRKKIPVDHRTDVYSLGATMYEAISGRPPFRGKDHADTLSQITERDPLEPRKLNPRVPKDLETIVLKCLRKEVGDRYGTAEALGQDLRRLVRGDPIEARYQSAWERVSRRLRKNRSRLLVAGAFILVLLILGWSAWRGHVKERDASRLHHDAVVTEAARDLYKGQLMLLGMDIDYLSPTLFPFRGLKFKKGRAGVEEDLRRLSEVAAAVPERPEACFYLALMYRVLGEDEAAVREALEALQRDPDFVPAEVLAQEVAERTLAVSDDRLDQMLSRYRERYGWQESWLLAYQHVRAGDWSAAAKAYSRLIAFREREGEPYIGCAVEALMGRGLAFLRTGDWDRAIRDFAGARGLWRGLPEAGLALGAAYYLKGDFKQAEIVFGELYATSADDERAEVATWIAGAYGGVNERQKVEEWSARIDGWKRTRLEIWFLYDQNRFEECMKALGTVLEASPDDLWSLMGVGWARISMQSGRSGLRWDEERRALLADARRTMGIYPNDAHVRAILATALQLNGLQEEALTMAESAVAVELHHGVQPFIGTRTLAWILRMHGEFDRALDTLRTAKETYGLENRFLLAETLEAAERYQEALDEYQAVRGPESKSARLASLLARVLNRLARHTEAAERASEALEGDPGNATAHEELAIALWRQDQTNEALDVVKKGVEELPDRVRIRLLHGQILEDMGKVEEAARSYCDALRLDSADRETNVALVELLRRHEALARMPEVAATRAAIEKRLASGRHEQRLDETLSVIRELSQRAELTPATSRP